MPELFIFLLKVNAALILFCLGYYLVLRRLTFYTLNRIYLVCAILFASIYPRINLSDFAERHQQLTLPVQNMIADWKAPAKNLAAPLDQPDYWHLAEVLFWMGVVLFATRLIMQFFSLYKLYRNSEPARLGGHDVRVITGETGPFSFWQSIYINPANLGPADLKSVLQHEQIHVNEWHTLDILLAELSTVFYWFNPGVWLMKKAIRENIEFITDRKILQKGADTRQYQYSMLNVCLAKNQNPIVNHFNISTIKKRIIMMNAKRSSKFTLTRYAFVLPAVIVLLLIFSFSGAGIAKKGRNVFKNMAVSVSALKITPGANPIAKTTVHVSKSIQIPIPLKKTDTSAKLKSAANGVTVTDVKIDSQVYTVKGFKISDNKLKKPANGATVTAVKIDSQIYIVNGVKVSKDKFRIVDGKNIKNVAVVWGRDAKQYTVDTTRDVIVINTKDTLVVPEPADALDVITVDAKAPKTRTLTKTRKVIVTSAAPKEASVVTIDEDAVPPLSIDLKPGVAYTYTTTVTKDGPGSDNAPVKVLIKGINATGGKTGVDNLSDKLVFIDGKLATDKDMKKLRAADIKSIDVKKDAKTKKQYGDKAKNGVLFITTKK